MDPPFEALEAQIEGMWRELLGSELTLFPMPEVRQRQAPAAHLAGLDG